MKYYKRLKIYKASNVLFNPEKCEAFSYRWWKFVAVIEGKVVFNWYRYSNSTTGHQWKVHRLLKDLGIEVHFEAFVRKSLSEFETIDALSAASKLTRETEAQYRKERRRETARAYRLKKLDERMNAEGFYTAEQWAERAERAKRLMPRLRLVVNN